MYLTFGNSALSLFLLFLHSHLLVFVNSILIKFNIISTVPAPYGHFFFLLVNNFIRKIKEGLYA